MLATFDLPTTFVEFLARAYSTPRFFNVTSSPTDWKVEQPFFSVPAGPNGRNAYFEAASRQQVDLLRKIDQKTCASWAPRETRRRGICWT